MSKVKRTRKSLAIEMFADMCLVIALGIFMYFITN